MSQLNSKLQDLDIGDILSLIDSPQSDVTQAVNEIIKDELNKVKDSWLINGLLDYFFATNSKKMLDVLIKAPENHIRHLLDKICDGFRSSDPFKYTNLLFYAVKYKPSPTWIRKLPSHTVLKELINMLLYRKNNLIVNVSGIMILIILLELIPYEIGLTYLTSILDVFWAMVKLSHVSEEEMVLKPYLQVAVYSLYHRLYALYPCNLLNYMRSNIVNQPNKTFFLNTLRPMIDHVRLHPLLVFETKETETSKSRWVGLDQHALLNECSKLCLDHFESTCEEIQWSWYPPSEKLDIISEFPDPKSLILCQSDNNFWCPGNEQSPLSTSIPHTPVYRFSSPLLHSYPLNTQESSPEAAIEATPDTTPFTSPLKPEFHRIDSSYLCSKIDLKNENVSNGERRNLKFVDRKEDDKFSKLNRVSILQSKLEEVSKEKEQIVLEDRSYSPLKNDAGAKVEPNLLKTQLQFNETGTVSQSTITGDKKDFSKDRRRKVSIYDKKLNPINTADELSFDMTNISANQGNKEPIKDTFDDRKISEESAESATSNRKENEMNQGETTDDDLGLGMPTSKTMQDFLKTIQTKRLRFFSQCAAPPDFSVLADYDHNPPSYNKYSDENTYKKSQYSSCPNLNSINNYPKSSILPTRTTRKSSSTVPLLVLSPKEPIGSFVEKCDSFTQTEEERTIVNPYEQFLEALLPTSKKSISSEIDHLSEALTDLSPHQILKRYIAQMNETNYENICNSDFIEKMKILPMLDAINMLMLFEQHKREVHALRNRRLLTKAKKIHDMHERERGYQQEIENLNSEIASLKKEIYLNMQLNNDVNIFQSEALKKIIDKENTENKMQIELNILKDEYSKIVNQMHELRKELGQTQSALIESDRKLKVQSKLTMENSSLRLHVENLQKQLVLTGELQIQSQQRLSEYQKVGCELNQMGMSMENYAALKEIQELRKENNSFKASIQTLMVRVNQLEKDVKCKEVQLNSQKDLVQAAAAAGAEQCQAMEHKCKYINDINIALEQQIMKMHDTIASLTQEIKYLKRKAGLDYNIDSISSKPLNFEECSIVDTNDDKKVTQLLSLYDNIDSKLD